MDNSPTSIFHALAELEQKNEPGALCVLVRSRGSTPRHEASKMVVYADGRILGTIGGGEMENRVISEALQAIEDGQPRFLEYNMSDPSRGDPGVCGGQVEIFVDPLNPRPLLVVIGSGHVGRAVVHLAYWIGFRVAVSDDRPEFCTPEAVPEAGAFYPIPMQELPANIKITQSTYFVLTTRSADIDIAGLPALLQTPAAYIGVIGSRRRWATTVEKLLELGISPEKIKWMHSPIGLDLHAETPQEIALSIMAEIIMIRNGNLPQKQTQ